MNDFWNSETHYKNAFDPQYFTPIYKKVSKHEMPGLPPFEFLIRYVETPARQHEPLVTHRHNQYELYINCCGDVSFMVQNNIYPISNGTILLLRPNTFHHCIYNSSCMHNHYWILFSLPKDSCLLDDFFDENVMISLLSEFEKSELLSLCERLMDKNLSTFKKYALFFDLLNILLNKKTHKVSNYLPIDVSQAMQYIQNNLLEKIIISDLAQYCHVSENTLERHFLSALKITPFAYIQSQRLFRAVTLLNSNKSILDICLESGFSDYSHFIVLFKKHYGITPLQYKKKYFQ